MQNMGWIRVVSQSIWSSYIKRRQVLDHEVQPLTRSLAAGGFEEFCNYLIRKDSCKPDFRIMFEYKADNATAKAWFLTCFGQCLLGKSS